jgi:integrase
VTALALDPGLILAEAARLREAAVKDKTYQATPIGQLAKRYLDGLAFDNYSPKTIEERERYLAYLAIDYAHLTPAEIVEMHLREFLARWKDSAVNTRRQAVSTIRVFFDWAHEHDFIAINPARKIRTPRTKQQDSRRNAYERNVVRQLVAAQTQRRDRAALLLMYWCALRRGELRQVQVRDLDFYNRILTVHGKGGTVLEQNLPEPVARELEAYLLDAGAQPDWFLLSPQKKVKRGTYPLYSYDTVTPNPREPYSLSGITRWFENCRARAGLEHVGMHELRHTAGTHFHMEGHDLVATQHFMRHANPATTAKTYVHLDRVRAVADVQRRMADPLDEDDAA